MTWTKEMLYYEVLAEFKRQFYKDALTKDHLIAQKIEIKKMNLSDGTPDDTYNFRGWELQKNDIRYLISDTIGNKPIKIKDILPIKPTKIKEVGAKGLVYSHIKKPITIRFKAQQTRSFKELVTFLSSFNHSNPLHQELNWFKGLASLFYRYNDRTCTPPGFGKDSTVDILGNLIGRCGTIESPTLAKLEERAMVQKWLAINEIIDISKADWRIIEQFLLAAGAHKPEVTKHSRSYGGVGEVIDMSNLSISLMYNDITNYAKKENYFDFVSKGAVKDRFAAFRLHGTYKEDFNKMAGVNIANFVKEHMDEYIDLIHNLTYYEQHIDDLQHGYSRDLLIKMPDRWRTNIGRLLNVVDLYCESQEEFDNKIAIINRSLQDYRAMIAYQDMLGMLKSKIGIPQSITERVKTIEGIIEYLRKKRNDKLMLKVERIRDEPEFINKIQMIDKFSLETKVEDTAEFWV